MKRKISIFFVFLTAVCVFSSVARAAEKRVYPNSSPFSFPVPEGWSRKDSKDGTVTLSAPFNKNKMLNPYIIFSQHKMKNAPDSPPPEDLWGKTVVRLIRKVDPKAEILLKKAVLVAGKPGFISAAYVTYKKKKDKIKTFQKACTIWDGKNKLMSNFILITHENDRKSYEAVFDKLIKGVEMK